MLRFSFRYPQVAKQVVFSDEVVSHSPPPPPSTSPNDLISRDYQPSEWSKRVSRRGNAMSELETEAKRPRLLPSLSNDNFEMTENNYYGDK